MTRFAYLHGFLSGPTSSKGRFLATQFGGRFAARLDLLDLNGRGGPSMLSHYGAFQAIDRHWRTRQDVPLRLIGSSFGGWAAAAYAAQHPERVDRLLLLNPVSVVL